MMGRSTPFGDAQLDADLAAILGPLDGIAPTTPDRMPEAGFTRQPYSQDSIAAATQTRVPDFVIAAIREHGGLHGSTASRMPASGANRAPIAAMIGVALLSFAALNFEAKVPIEQVDGLHTGEGRREVARKVEPMRFNAFSVVDPVGAPDKRGKKERVLAMKTPREHKPKSQDLQPRHAVETQTRSASVPENVSERPAQKLAKTIDRPVMVAVNIPAPEADAVPSPDAAASRTQLVTMGETIAAEDFRGTVGRKRARRDSISAIRLLRKQ